MSNECRDPESCGVGDAGGSAVYQCGCRSDRTARFDLVLANEEIAAAWRVLGTTEEEAADDPETASLSSSIRVALEYEQDKHEHLRVMVDQLLENEFGGFYLSAPEGSALAQVRALLRPVKLHDPVHRKSQP